MNRNIIISTFSSPYFTVYRYQEWSTIWINKTDNSLFSDVCAALSQN